MVVGARGVASQNAGLDLLWLRDDLILRRLGRAPLGHLQLGRLLLDGRPYRLRAAVVVGRHLGVGRELRGILRQVLVERDFEVALLQAIVAATRKRDESQPHSSLSLFPSMSVSGGG